MTASRRKQYAKDVLSKRHRRIPKPHVRVEDEVEGSQPRVEVIPHKPAPEPTVLPKPVPPKEHDLSKLPPAMRQALLSRRIDEDWRGIPEP